MCTHCSGSGGCPCTCNYATDAGCTCRDLKDTLNVTITKGAVYASYPLIYQQAFNYQPTEVRPSSIKTVSKFFMCAGRHSKAIVLLRQRQVYSACVEACLAQAIIRTGANFPISSCNADPLSTSPTCGWATEAHGNNLPSSQGFCCSCSSSALAAATLGSGTNQCTHSAWQCLCAIACLLIFIYAYGLKTRHEALRSRSCIGR